MIVTDADAWSAPTRDTLDSPYIRADVLPLSHGGRSHNAEVMRRPMNPTSTRTESMTPTGIATVMAKNATTSNQTNGSADGQLVAALAANRSTNCNASEAILLRTEAIPHFSRSQSQYGALNDFGNRGRGTARTAIEASTVELNKYSRSIHPGHILEVCMIH